MDHHRALGSFMNSRTLVVGHAEYHANHQSDSATECRPGGDAGSAGDGVGYDEVAEVL